jgi:hypothetical protein
MGAGPEPVDVGLPEPVVTLVVDPGPALVEAVVEPGPAAVVALVEPLPPAPPPLSPEHPTESATEAQVRTTVKARRNWFMRVSLVKGRGRSLVALFDGRGPARITRSR